jgi:digeranylgeranylglycerophospholipid reductase
MEKRIAIIGGGPGGLSAAIKAAESGLKVHLFEKGEIGSGIKCAEGFIDTLGVLEKPAAGVLFKVGRVNFFDGRAHYVNLPENLGLWMIDRATWQKSLAKRAASLGVDITEKCPIDKDRLSRMMVDYGFVIDASGAPSLTSKMYGFLSDYTRNAILLAQYAVEGDFGFVGPNTILVGYERRYIGYYYIFPKGPDIANVGVCRFNYAKKNSGVRLKTELDRLMNHLALRDYRILNKFSSFTPSIGITKLVWGNVLLVGDAAALCSPLHGGGMDMACLSGLMAAKLIASNQVDRYPQRLRHMVKKKFVMERRIGQLWGLFGYPLISCVLKSPELVKKIIFNKPPLPQLIGLIPSGRNFTGRCTPFAK